MTIRNPNHEELTGPLSTMGRWIELMFSRPPHEHRQYKRNNGVSPVPDPLIFIIGFFTGFIIGALFLIILIIQ